MRCWCGQQSRYQRWGNTQQTSERPSRRSGKEQGYLLAREDKNENSSTSEQAGEIKRASDEGSAGSLGVSGVASSDHRVRGKCLLPSSELCRVPAQDRGKPKSPGRSEWAPASRIVPGRIPPLRLPSHGLAELGRRGGYVGFVPAQAQPLPHTGSPPRARCPDLGSRQEATACYVLIYFLSQMGE